MKNISHNILYENSFADITFDQLSVMSYEFLWEIHNQAFGKSASKLKQLNSLTCNIQNDPPNDHVWNLLGQFTELKEIAIGLNVSEIRSFVCN